MKNEKLLTIVVTCADGGATTFEQPDKEAALKLVGQLDPARVFTNPFVMIAGSRSLTVFPSASIARIDLLTELALDWDFHLGIHDAYEISPQEFERLAAQENMNSLGTDTQATILTIMEMENAGLLHLVLVLNEAQEPMIQADFGMSLQRFLSAPTFHARRLGGGGIIINPHHILRFRFYPSPPEPPKGALKAEATNSVRS